MTCVSWMLHLRSSREDKSHKDLPESQLLLLDRTELNGDLTEVSYGASKRTRCWKNYIQCFFWKKPCLLTQNLLCSKTFLRERKNFASEHKCFVSKPMFCKWTVSREIQKFCNRTQMFYKQKQSFLGNAKNLQANKCFASKKKFFASETCFMSEQFLREHKCFASKQMFCKQKQFLGVSQAKTFLG